MIKWGIEYMENVNNGIQKVEDVEHFVTMYKSIFHAMTASAESKSEVFSRKVYADIDDLNELYDRITRKLESHYSNAGSKVKVNVSFDGKRNYSFDNWSDFSTKQWYENNPITSIIIKWEYHILLPEYPIPQPHVLVVKISDGLKPEQMLNLVFTGKIESIELLEEEIYPVVARVDYINYDLGDELLHIVADWNEGLKSKQTETTGIINVLKKHKKIVVRIVNSLMKFLALCCSLLIIDAYIYNLNIQKLGDLSQRNICFFVTIICIAYVFSRFIGRIANFCSSSFVDNISSRNNYHVFGIDKGDQELQAKYEKIKNDNQNKALTSLVLSVIINIICGIMSSIIATIIFL